MKAGFCATGIYPFISSIIPDETFAPSRVTHNEDAQVSNVVTLIETPAPALFSQKSRKLLLCLVHFAKLRTSLHAVFRLRRWWWFREECNHCTFTRNIRTLKGLNNKLISKHAVNSMGISDRSKNKSIINPLKPKSRLFYLKTQSVPRSKHVSSRL
jgi:hypothetical protein